MAYGIVGEFTTAAATVVFVIRELAVSTSRVGSPEDCSTGSPTYAVSAVGITESILTILFTIAIGLSVATTATVAASTSQSNFIGCPFVTALTAGFRVASR